MTTKNIKWLHLSDFHVGMDNYSQRKLFSEITSFVRTQTEKGNGFDFVFITGDIANKGLRIEYNEFVEAFLYPLVDALGAKWGGKIFLVPGNHDVDRTLAPYFDIKSILAPNSRFFDPTFEGKSNREQLLPRFAAFQDLSDLTDCESGWLKGQAGTFEKLVELPCANIAVIGINTAWLSKDAADRHLLMAGSNALEDALTRQKSADLKIVLGHHPLSWLDDNEAERFRTIFAEHSAIYLCGHLHKNDSRYENAGAGAFLALRCGAAFQGRSDDTTEWVNGFQMVEVNFETREAFIKPLHWSSFHRQWKVTTDAFVNERKRNEDWWSFPLPRRGLIGAGTEVVTDSTASPELALKPPPGWSLADTNFLREKQKEVVSGKFLHYFDGRPPDWEIALSQQVPRREIVSQLRSRFNSLEGALKPTVTMLLGAGGEGKSTAFLQTVVDLVLEEGWKVIFRHGEETLLSWAFLDHCAARFHRVLVASDDAHSLSKMLPLVLDKLRSRANQNVHFLLCARTIDWRAEVTKDEAAILESSNYSEVLLSGVKEGDAKKIVQAWAAFGKEGLSELNGLTEAAAVARLTAAAKSEDESAIRDTDDGVLLGAMLQIRYGDKLKDKVRSILYKLREISAPGGSLLDAFAMIAAMHAEGLRFLSSPVLATALQCSSGDLKRRVLNPLADEAMAAGGGRFVLCRHRAIANAAIDILREANLYGDTDTIFPELARAAVTSRTNGEYVPDLAKWDYDLPQHFITAGKVMLAVPVAEALQKANPDDIRLRVNLSKIYRQAREFEKAVELFTVYSGDIKSRVMWSEWGVALGSIRTDPYAAILVASASLCDLPNMYPVSRQEARSVINLAMAARHIYSAYGDEKFARAFAAAVEIGAAIGEPEMVRSLYDLEAEQSSPRIERARLGDPFVCLSDAVRAALDFVDIEELTERRISRTEVLSFQGLKDLYRRLKTTSP